MKLRKEPQLQNNSVVILGGSGTELCCLQVLQTVCAEAVPTGAQQAGESRAVLVVGGFSGSATEPGWALPFVGAGERV